MGSRSLRNRVEQTKSHLDVLRAVFEIYPEARLGNIGEEKDVLINDSLRLEDCDSIHFFVGETFLNRKVACCIACKTVKTPGGKVRVFPHPNNAKYAHELSDFLEKDLEFLNFVKEGR